MNREELVSLAEYNVWANDRIAGVAATLDQEAFLRDMRSSMPSIQATLFHIMNAQHVWIGRMKGEKRANLKRDDYLTAPALREKWGQVEAEFVDFVKGADPNATQTYHASNGTGYTQPIWQMVLHVINHSTHHRGQVITMLRQQGLGPVPATDLAVYLRSRGA